MSYMSCYQAKTCFDRCFKANFDIYSHVIKHIRTNLSPKCVRWVPKYQHFCMSTTDSGFRIGFKGPLSMIASKRAKNNSDLESLLYN